MNTPRFNYDRMPGAALRPRARKFPKWIRVAHVSEPVLHNSAGSGRKKIFAIVKPPMPSDLGRKSVRRVLIFDNHPDSLRLVSEQYLNPDVDPAGQRRTSPSHIILGLALILTLVVGMIWPLL